MLNRDHWSESAITLFINFGQRQKGVVEEQILLKETEINEAVENCDRSRPEKTWHVKYIELVTGEF